MAYGKQSKSLKYVQKFGPQLEKSTRDTLKWPSGRVVYYQNPSKKVIYDLETDACWPSIETPKIFLSITYCKPDKPGHSNENKLQLKVGELMLLKSRYPEIRSVLVVGGNRETWLPYILQAFEFFFDKVIFAWESDFEKHINSLRKKSLNIPIKHAKIWERFANEWRTINLYEGEPISSSLRKKLWLKMKAIKCEGELPSCISNAIFKHCMNTAYQRHKETRGKNGKEWSSYVHNNWDQVWESRSFFNPAEAAIDLVLVHENFAHLGGLAIDEDVPSLIHHLGGTEVDKTKVSEDFILYSLKYDKPIFIQSKSTGGGLEGHGKNIQNRTKEQLTRSLFYRGYIENGQMILRDKDYIWIGILDGNWGVTQKTPLKYMHMLQWAGYDFLIGADTLVNNDLDVKYDNPLTKTLHNLNCTTNNSEFIQKWEKWSSTRFRK